MRRRTESAAPELFGGHPADRACFVILAAAPIILFRIPRCRADVGVDERARHVQAQRAAFAGNGASAGVEQLLKLDQPAVELAAAGVDCERLDSRERGIVGTSERAVDGGQRLEQVGVGAETPAFLERFECMRRIR